MATTCPIRRSAAADPSKTLRRDFCRHRPASENHDPNLPLISSPSPKKTATPSSKPKNSPNPCRTHLVAPPPPPSGRKIALVKRSSKKGTDGTLQDRRDASHDSPTSESPTDAAGEELVVGDASPELGATVKARKMRSKLMEEAMSSLPEQGCGRVLHLVKAFESILSLSRSSGEGEGQKNQGKWALPGMGAPQVNISSNSSSDQIFRSQEDFVRCSSLDGPIKSLSASFGAVTIGGGRKSRRNSSDSVGSRNKKLGVTHQCPFKLRTEQRGKHKEEQFLRKVKEMLLEEAKQRIPQAQGLPWTTDEPECLVRPFVKAPTEPEDIVLHSDVRALERAEFDNYVAERIALAEKRRLERERQQRLEEEEQIRRMRKALVPKAQPMPYFERPFVPKKSDKPQTIPKEPRFHRVRLHKPCFAALEEVAKETRISGSFRF